VLYRDTVVGHGERKGEHRVSLSQTGHKKMAMKVKTVELGRRHQVLELDGVGLSHTGTGPDETYRLRLTGRKPWLKEVIYGRSRACVRFRDLELERLGDKYRLAKGQDLFGRVYTELGHGDGWTRIRLRRPLKAPRFLGKTPDVSVHLERWREGVTPWKGTPAGPKSGGDYAEVGVHWRCLGVSLRRLPTGEWDAKTSFTLFRSRF
jgi:hypothetical protein